jgi:hypothetical protein
LKSSEYIKIITFAVKSFFILALLLIIILLGIIFFYSYEEFTVLLLNAYGKADKLSEFRSAYLTPSRFIILKISFVCLLLLLIPVLIRIKSVSTFIAVKVASLINSGYLFGQYLFEKYYKLSVVEKTIFYFVIILIGLVKLYFIPRYFFHIDEITSYIFFIKRGFFVITSYYPNPNNHILYSLIVYLAQPFFSDPVYLLKIPSLIVSLLASVLLFLFLIRYFNFSVSVLGTLLFSFWGQFFVYSLFGRGYVLMTLFTIVATFSVIEIISGKNEKFVWHIYVASSILGFYTMVIYFYPFISLLIVLLIFIISEKKYSFIKTFIYYNLLVTIGVLFLYTPVFLISGISAITSNSWIIKPGFMEFISNLPLYVENAFKHILDTNQSAVLPGLIVICLAIIILIKRKRKVWLWMIVAFFLTPVFILCIQQIKPYERIWTYLVFPFCLCMIVIIDYLFSLIKNIRVKKILIIIVFVFITVYTIIRSIDITKPNPEGIYYDIDRITEYVVAENAGRGIYTNENSYNLYLRYHATRAGINLVPEMAVDPLINNFSYILLIPGSSFPGSIEKDNYILKEKNPNIEVYKLK